MSNLSPLGKPVTYTGQYDAGLLCPLDRRRSRDAIGVPAQLPFFGADIWNAYELSWLNERGKPHIAIATFCVPANSPNIVELKSFKLYLGSFHRLRSRQSTRYATPSNVMYPRARGQRCPSN